MFGACKTLLLISVYCLFLLRHFVTAKFEGFFKSYIDKFKYKSVATEDFKSFLLSYFHDNSVTPQIDWDLWLYTCGMPPIIPL